LVPPPHADAKPNADAQVAQTTDPTNSPFFTAVR
jgi:hypothetical protein